MALVTLVLAAWLSSAQDGLTVSAAASLTDVMTALQAAYAEAGGGRIQFNFAGSNTLARQIASGAPVDLFISADAAQMDVVDKAGAIDRASRVDLVGNRLAVIVRRDAAIAVANAAALSQSKIRRIAIGDPEGVPAGVYARQYLEASGLWSALAPRTVPVANVRAAVAAVENGSADAAIVYETDAAVSKDVAVAFVASGAGAPRIVYPAAIVAAARHRAEAARFLTFLHSRAAAAIFARYKFVPLAGQ